jgi:hypothetical protein
MNEDDFFDKQLIEAEYIQIYKRMCLDPDIYISKENKRNYSNLLYMLSEIFKYNEQHARSYTKRIKRQATSWKDCEAVYCEIIVYYNYLKLKHEGIIDSIELVEEDYDLKITRLDGSAMYFEIFCVMPDFKQLTDENHIIVQKIKTHTQNELSSIRQKLLRKITIQKQLSKPRENYVVIEINDSLLEVDFTILSSLSSGYKLIIDEKTQKVISEGYDWSNCIFEDPYTKHIKAIIYFGTGHYEERKIVFNPYFYKK